MEDPSESPLEFRGPFSAAFSAALAKAGSKVGVDTLELELGSRCDVINHRLWFYPLQHNAGSVRFSKKVNKNAQSWSQYRS